MATECPSTAVLVDASDQTTIPPESYRTGRRCDWLRRPAVLVVLAGIIILGVVAGVLLARPFSTGEYVDFR